MYGRPSIFDRSAPLRLFRRGVAYMPHTPLGFFFNFPTTFVSEGGIAFKDGRTFSRTSSNARATSTLAFRVTSDAGDDGMVSRQTASPNASQSPLLSLVRRTVHGPISPEVTSLCERAHVRGSIIIRFWVRPPYLTMRGAKRRTAPMVLCNCQLEATPSSRNGAST